MLKKEKTVDLEHQKFFAKKYDYAAVDFLKQRLC
jgi:hypothetical protein